MNFSLFPATSATGQAYLEKLTVGAKVCVQELRKYALHPGDDHLKDDKAESRVLRVLMDKAIGWKECPLRTRSTKYPEAGPQRCWEKQNAFIVVDDSEVFP